MDLKACPSCHAMAPLHVEACSFCGATLPVPASPDPDPGSAGATRDGNEASWPPAPPAPGSAWAAPDPSANPPHPGPSYLPAGAAPVPGRVRPRPWWIVGLVVTVAVVGLIGVTVAVGMNAVSDLERQALDGDGTWETFRDPDGAFVVDLPAEPSAGPVDRSDRVTGRSYTANVGRALFIIQIYDIEGGGTAGVAGEELLAQMPAVMTDWTGGAHNAPVRTTAGGLPAIQFDIDAGDQRWSATAVLTGGRVILLAAGGPAVAVGGHARMVDSFHPLDPG